QSKVRRGCAERQEGLSGIEGSQHQYHHGRATRLAQNGCFWRDPEQPTLPPATPSKGKYVLGARTAELLTAFFWCAFESNPFWIDSLVFVGKWARNPLPGHSPGAP